MLSRVAAAARGVPGVRAIEKLKVRKAGMGYYVDLHVQADPQMSLHDAHVLSGMVKSPIREAVPEVHGALIHMEPFEGKGVSGNAGSVKREQGTERGKRAQERRDGAPGAGDRRTHAVHRIEGELLRAFAFPRPGRPTRLASDARGPSRLVWLAPDEVVHRPVPRAQPRRGRDRPRHVVERVRRPPAPVPRRARARP